VGKWLLFYEIMNWEETAKKTVKTIRTDSQVEATDSNPVAPTKLNRAVGPETDWPPDVFLGYIL
jgi:hypothetical protein